MKLWEKIRNNSGLKKEYLEKFVYSRNIDAVPYKPEEAMAWLALTHKPFRKKDRQGNDYTYYMEKSVDAALDALFKQMLKKPIWDDENRSYCPLCESEVEITKYCPYCGQAIDRSEE